MYLCYIYLQMCAYIHKHMCKCNDLYKLLISVKKVDYCMCPISLSG